MEDVVIRCLPFYEKHIPVVISPQVALQRSFPDSVSNILTCLSVPDAAATDPLSSIITFRKSGAYLLFGSGLFSQTFVNFSVPLRLRILSCPVMI